MTLYIHAAFNTADIGTFAITISGSIGSGTCTLPAGRYCHTAFSGVSGIADHGELRSALQSALNSTPGVGTGWTVSYNGSTHAYTIANATSFSLSWGNFNLAAALGFNSTVGTTTSTVSQVRPYYVIVPRIDGRSNFSDVYEGDEEIVTENVADDGIPFSVALDRSLTGPMYCDWQHTVETREATYARAATDAVPWTWQHFFFHCRGEHPFVLNDGAVDTVYMLRADGARFDSSVRKPHAIDYHGQWSIDIRARDFGQL